MTTILPESPLFVRILCLFLLSRFQAVFLFHSDSERMKHRLAWETFGSHFRPLASMFLCGPSPRHCEPSQLQPVTSSSDGLKSLQDITSDQSRETSRRPARDVSPLRLWYVSGTRSYDTLVRPADPPDQVFSSYGWSPPI